MTELKMNARILMVGNPNAGKTMLFNRLTGLRARVANFPGITVDFKEGNFELPTGETITVVDLPGTYSLISRSEDEDLTVKGVFGKLKLKPATEILVAVVNATQLKRNLYLVSQLLDLKRPLVIALTMMDEIEAKGSFIDVSLLSQKLGVPVVPLSAATGAGIQDLLSEIKKTIDNVNDNIPALVKTEFLPSITEVSKKYQQIDKWLEGVFKDCTSSKRKPRFCLDDILLHRFLGLIFLILIFALMFEVLFAGSAPLIEWIDMGVASLSDAVWLLFPPESLFGSLVVDGVIAGVGSVIIFVPLIGILFLFIGILEDSGYLARATFLLDRIMSKVGLSGRAFVPLLSGFACAVPAIMATRVIESKKDRLITILVTPLMSCSARLPIYGLLIAVVFASAPPILGFIEVGALVLLLMYMLGIVAAVLVAFLLKRSVFKGPTPSLILELPPYRMPRCSSLLQNVWSRIQVFLQEAGTIILAMTIILWGFFTFPRYQPNETNLNPNKIEEIQLKNSYAGRLGQTLEPLVAPLGFDWKISVGILSSIAAREVFVSTLGIIYGLGSSQDETSYTLKTAIQNDIDPKTGRPVYTPLVALSLMVFYALSMQCMSTLATTKRETQSWKWPLFQLGYMTMLAWLCSFVLFQTGSMLGF